MGEEVFQDKYKNLYSNQRYYSKVSKNPIRFTPVFLSKRLIISFVTVFLTNFTLSQVACYIGISLYSMCYISSALPFESPLLNRVNFLNETFVLAISYFLLLFTNTLLPNLEVREQLGWILLYSVIGIVGINFVIVFSAIGQLLFKKL